MPGGIKISKPERLPKDNVSEADLHAWWNELINYLNQDEDFYLFKNEKPYGTWLSAEDNEDRIIVPAGRDNEEKLPIRQRQINNYLTIIAGCCSRDHYMHIIKQATSLKWIWSELQHAYQHQHKGKNFLNIIDIQWNSQETSPMSFYATYRAKILENLKPEGTHLQWKNNEKLSKAEVMTPTFEDHILLTVLNIIHPKLPAKVKEVYGPRLDDGKFLMDIKNDILTNVTKLLEDIEADEIKISAFKSRQQHEDPYQMAYMRGSFRGRGRGRPYRGQGNNRSGNKFCRLCHLARQSRQITLSHEIGDITCPSLSERDKEGIKSKVYSNAAVHHEEEEEEENLDMIANNYGYPDQVKCQKHNQSHDKGEHTYTHVSTNIHLIKPVPSQILTVYQHDYPLHLDLDSGCWISTIKEDIALRMNWTIHPNGQLARIADGKTVMKSIGEIHETFNRNNWSVTFSAIVMKELHTNIIAGNNFILENKIKQDLAARTITVHNKYVVPETNRNTELPQNPINTVINVPVNTVILPNQTMNLKVPHNEGEVILVEPVSTKQQWPQTQICTVQDNNIEIVNTENDVIRVKKPPVALRVMAETHTLSPKPSYVFKVNQASTNNSYTDLITKNEDRLNHDQKLQLKQILETNSEVFNKDLTQGYNGNSGPHQCKLKFANQERPSSKKVHCPTYNSNLNTLLQQVCDELTEANVLGIPQHDNVDIQHVMPCFLRKKQKAKDKSNQELTSSDVRLVVNTCELSKYIKSLPAKVTKPQEVYNSLAKWKYVIKTDLYQGFFQNHLHPSAQQWCCILTPHGGIRYFKRGIQGLINQSEELDEMLANIFKNMTTDSKMVKIADDFFLGGQTIAETLANFGEMVKLCHENNIKLSPNKTVLFPRTVDVLSWIWSEGGMLAPSPHRKQALIDTKHEDITTIKDLRSWLGLYKTFIYHTPNLTNILDPLDKVVGGKESKDPLTWTDELTKAFHNAKTHAAKIKQVYLPHPEDQLIITTDGARNPPGVGFLLQAKDTDGVTKPVRYYSVKLKQHHIKWNPCEIEAVAFGTAIEAFYDIIKESTKPVIICPDSKPVCDAAKLLQQGKFSLSPRIQTFLNNLGKINAEVQHISGKSGQNQPADFQSRNTESCKSDICQLCNYVSSQSDTIIHPKINSIQDQDIPYANREAWKNLQKQDKACYQAKNILSTGQIPSKKVGKVQSDTRKIASTASIAKDGLLIVPRTIPFSTNKEERIVVPTSYMKTLINQLHIRHQHPSRAQLKSIFDKYFFGIGTSNIIEETCNLCHLCQAVKKLPQQKIFSTTTMAQIPGTHFVCDIMRRAKQNIIVVRDQFSSYTNATIIESEKHQDIEEAIIDLISPIRAPGKVMIKTDQATAFQYLSKHQTSLKSLNVHIELANDFSKNAVATVDKGIQELQQELKRIQPFEKPISKAELSMAIMQLNNRLRRNGQISAREILFSRDYNKHTNLNLDDKALAASQLSSRNEANQQHNKNQKIIKPENIIEGDTVMLKQNPQKHRIRDTFMVKSTADDKITMQKIIIPQNNKPAKCRSKQYLVPKTKVFKAPLSNKPCEPTVQIRNYYDFDPVNRNHDSTDDSEDSDDETDRTSPIDIECTDSHLSDTQPDSDDHPNDNENDSKDEETSSPHSVYLSPDSNQSTNTQKSPQKTKTPRTEIWIQAKETPHHKKLLNLKYNLAAMKIQKWYREKRSTKLKRRCKIKAKQRIYKQMKGKSPEIERHTASPTEYQISSAEDDKRSKYLSCTNDNFLTSDSSQMEWDHNEQCLEMSFNNEHDDAFLTEPLNLTFENGMGLNRVYNVEQVLAEHHSPTCHDTPNTSTPVKAKTKGKSKSKFKRFLHL